MRFQFVGLILALVGSILISLEPSAAVCRAQYWLGQTAFVATVWSLLIPMYVVHAIFAPVKPNPPTNAQLHVSMVVAMAVTWILLGVEQQLYDWPLDPVRLPLPPLTACRF